MTHQGYYDDRAFYNPRNSKKAGRKKNKVPRTKKSRNIAAARRAIIAAVKKEGDRVIPRHKFGLAVDWLKGKIGCHSKALIQNAFSSLLRDDTFQLNREKARFELAA